MPVRPLAVSGALLTAGVLAVGVASPALAVCDAYSGTCPSPAGGGGGGALNGGTGNPGSADNAGTTDNPGGAANPGTTTTAERPGTLPFTGGELVLLSTVGIGALVGGTALVVAGRRKSNPAA